MREKRQGKRIGIYGGLKNENAAFERFFALSIELLCIADTEGHFLLLNPEWEKVLGFSLDELLKTNFLNLVHAEDIARTLEAIKRLESQQEVKQFVNRYRTKSGGYRWLEWRSFPFRNLIYAAAHDITERISTEKEREDAKRKSEDALDAAKMAYWEFDVATSSFTFNERFYRLHGITDAKADLMDGAAFRKYVVPEDSKKVEETITNAIAACTSFLENQIENRALRTDGGIIWINTWFRILRDADGRVSKVFGVNQDITDRKKIEESLDSVIKEKQILLAELQHRVKNSLSMIASLISLEEGRSQLSETREALSKIRSRVASLAALYDMLHETGDGGEIDLGKYVETIGRSVKDSLTNELKRVSLEVSCERVGLDVKRAAQIGLVVNELLTNALKYAFPGGKKGKIGLSLRAEADRIELSVTDDGIGLNPDFDAKTKSGLGFQLVRALAEQFGGEFTIKGKAVGTESRFRFRR